MDHFCYLCFMSVMHSFLFIAVLRQVANHRGAMGLSAVCDCGIS